MDKSLLSILNEEARLMDAIDNAKSLASAFQRRCEEIRRITNDCEAGAEDLAHYEGKVARYCQEANEYRRQLDAVRDDLMAYMTELFKNSNKEG